MQFGPSPQERVNGHHAAVPPPMEMHLAALPFYRQARATGQERGITFPSQHVDDLLVLQAFDPQPAQLLLERQSALAYPYSCNFGIADLVIDEGVFCPTLTSVSPFLLESVEFKPGERALDAFAGSGGFGVNAALYGAEAVVSFDTSAKAVACCEKNAARNNVSDVLQVRHGTMQETLAEGETFDLIIANPPLIPGEPANPGEEALFDGGLGATRDFIARLPHHLTKEGRCYLLTSDVIDRRGYEVDIAGICRDVGLGATTIAELHRSYESYRVHKIEHPARHRRTAFAQYWRHSIRPHLW